MLGRLLNGKPLGATAGEVSEGKIVPKLEQSYLILVATRVGLLELIWQQFQRHSKQC